MTLFYKIMNSLTPRYAKDPIPTPYWSNYSFRNHDAVGRMGARTEKFHSSFILIACLSGIRLTQRLRMRCQLLC